MLIELAHNPPNLSQLANGWVQVSFTLNTPFKLEFGARLSWQGATLAPWRVQEAHIDCLCAIAPSTNHLNTTVQLIQVGQALPHLNTHQPLLITAEGLGIADALRAASQLKQLAPNALALLSAESFPCIIKPAKFMVEAFPNAIAACPLLEDWGFANRLVHADLPGCIDSTLNELIQQPTFSAFQHLGFNHSEYIRTL